MSISIRNCSDLKSAGCGQWGRVFGNLFPVLDKALSRPGSKVDCPVTGHRLGFTLSRDFNESGVAFSYGDGKLDPVALAQFLGNMNCSEAFRSLRDALGDSGVSAPLHTAVRTMGNKKAKSDLRALLRRIWSESAPVSAHTTLALKYFALRGIPIDACSRKTLRFNPKALYRDDRSHETTQLPAIIALITHNEVPVGVHRIYVGSDGRKAQVAEPKKSLFLRGLSKAQIDSSVMPLARTASNVAFVTEGIEKGLAILSVNDTHNMDAAASAWCLENYTPADHIEHVVVWADKDRSNVGQDAAARLKMRMEAVGKKCIVVVPPIDIPDGKDKVDWDWILLQHGGGIIENCLADALKA